VNINKITVGAELELPFEIFLNADVFMNISGNVLEYKNDFGFFDYPGSQILPGININERVTSGKANIFGLRAVMHKEYLKFNFKVGHTVTQTEYIFENINFGESFMYSHANRHDFNLKAGYAVNENFKLYLEWFYKSGNYVTPRKQSYIPYNYTIGVFGTDTSAVIMKSIEGETLQSVGYRNTYRLPAYHRLDIGAKYQYEKHTFGIHIYNVYNRKNTNMVDFKENILSNSNELHAANYYVMPFFPSLSYEYRFR
jgi:hypothetical protein